MLISHTPKEIETGKLNTICIFMIEIGWQITSHKYANSSSNYYTKCRVEANNNREAVVVCARHVMKRPSKLSVLVFEYVVRNTVLFNHNHVTFNLTVKI